MSNRKEDVISQIHNLQMTTWNRPRVEPGNNQFGNLSINIASCSPEEEKELTELISVWAEKKAKQKKLKLYQDIQELELELYQILKEERGE